MSESRFLGEIFKKMEQSQSFGSQGVIASSGCLYLLLSILQTKVSLSSVGTVFCKELRTQSWLYQGRSRVHAALYILPPVEALTGCLEESQNKANLWYFPQYSSSLQLFSLQGLPEPDVAL